MHYTYNQTGFDTNLIGMNNPELVEANLDVLYNGLSVEEKEVMQFLQEEYAFLCELLLCL